MTTQLSAESMKAKIGVSLPLTGEIAEYGVAVRNGIQLAQELLPKKLENVDFIYEDNQYEAKKSATAFNKLMNFDKVDLIFSWGELPLHSIAPIAERNKFPTMAMSFDPEPSLNKKYIMRSINYSDQYAEATLQYMRRKGFKKIAIVAAEDPFFNSLLKGLNKYKQSDETIDVVFSFLPDISDFKTAVAKLKNSNYDIMGVYLFPGQVSNFFRQARAAGLTLPAFGTDIFESTTINPR